MKKIAVLIFLTFLSFQLYAADDGGTKKNGGTTFQRVGLSGTVSSIEQDGFKLEIANSKDYNATLNNGLETNIEPKNRSSYLRVSAGSQNTITIPAGHTLKSITFRGYSANDLGENQNHKDVYISELNGTSYDGYDNSPYTFGKPQNESIYTITDLTPTDGKVTFTVAGERALLKITVETEIENETVYGYVVGASQSTKIGQKVTSVPGITMYYGGSTWWKYTAANAEGVDNAIWTQVENKEQVNMTDQWKQNSSDTGSGTDRYVSYFTSQTDYDGDASSTDKKIRSGRRITSS